MSRLIEDLIDFTRTRLGTHLPMSPADVELLAVVGQVVDELRALYPGRAIEFHPGGPLWGRWDADRLAQMVSNLVGNALQHGEPARPVTVQAGPAGEQVRIAVHNAGPPIPAELLPRIFDPMVRGATRQAAQSERRASVGLGLYVCREIARAHGGSIEVASDAAQGTTFTVHLPQDSQACPQVQAAGAGASAGPA